MAAPAPASRPSPAASFAASFAGATSTDAPKTRWWWTCGEITPDQIRTQLESIRAAGFGGVEISCFYAFNPEQRWGSAAMRDRMQVVLDAARKLNLTVDFTVGASWPLTVPGVGADDTAAAQEAVQGSVILQAGQTFDGVVPQPQTPPAAGVNRKALVALQAARCTADCRTDGAKPADLVAGSSIDLTGRVRGDAVTWTAPGRGTWLLLATWQRGTGQLPVAGEVVNVRPGHVVDHFSAAGAKATVDFWRNDVLTPPMRQALRTAGGDLFEDSLELTANAHWTTGFLEQFRQRRGYDLRPYLPVLFIDGLHRQYSSVSIDDQPRYAYDAATDRRVRKDYYQTLTDLFRDFHIAPLKAFANSLGLQYRAQTYGDTLDFAQLSTSVDIPETEGLVASGAVPAEQRLGDYRIQAASAHLGRKPIYSTECCAVYNGAYGQSWEDLIARFNMSFAGGVNQIVLHGFGHRQGNGDTTWPGWSPFTYQGGNGFSETFDERHATWADTPKITAWLARMHFLLRTGTPQTDIAVYQHNLDRQPVDRIDAHSLTDTGYSIEYVAPEHLRLPAARVFGRVLAPGAGDYRALLVVDQQEMPLDTAQRLLAYARQGLPIVFVGTTPTRTVGNDRRDGALRATVAELQRQKSVASVPTQADVPVALARLGAQPGVRYTQPAPLLTTHRKTTQGDLYVVHNPTAEAVTREVTMQGADQPAILDPWSGSISSVPAYRAGRSGVTVDVRLDPGDTVVYGVGRFAPASRWHVVTPGADVTTGNNGELLLRSTTPGTRQVRLSNGATATATIDTVPAARSLDTWQLAVDDWHRGPDGALEITKRRLDLTELKPWSQIPELQDVSGIGTYTSTVDLPDGWTGGRHAILDLGKVSDTVDVWVNGNLVTGLDQVAPRADVSRFLRAGTNEIRVEVATQLRNTLRVTEGFAGQAAEPRQDYGLIGPVTLQPYGQAPLRPPAK